MRYLIYGLVDPRNEQLRYIGKSSNGMVRPMEHMQENLPSTRPWVRELKKVKMGYDIIVIEECSQRKLADLEAFYINYFKYIGCDLLNVSLGSPGAPPGILDYKEAKIAWEVAYWDNLLTYTGGNVAAAARFAGLHRASVYERLSVFGDRLTVKTTPMSSKWLKKQKPKLVQRLHIS
jgi:hypothetical protein